MGEGLASAGPFFVAQSVRVRARPAPVWPAAAVASRPAPRSAPALRPARARPIFASRDRKSVVEGKSVSVRVDLGGRRILKKKNKKEPQKKCNKKETAINKQ